MSRNIKQDLVNELHKSARKNFRRRRVIVVGLNDLFQADLIEMIKYARLNKGFKYILVVINVFSKYVWCEPVKSKRAEDVTSAMKKILTQAKNPPKHMQTDLGREFYNKIFEKLMNDMGIKHYSTYSNLKASVVERVNRTLKNKMWKQFSLQGNYKWLDILPKIVEDYNNSVHRTIGMKPKDVNENNEKHLFQTIYSKIKMVDPKRAKFKVNDLVRISKYREAFSKGYTPNWSNEIFKVVEVKKTNPYTYILEDSEGQKIKGGFYSEELNKVTHPNVYLVEKILKKKGKNVFVKWLGLSNKHNSWISSSKLI